MGQFGNMLNKKYLPTGGYFFIGYFVAISFLSSTFFFGDSILLPLILPSSMRSAPYSSMRTLIQPAIGIEMIAPTRPKV